MPPFSLPQIRPKVNNQSYLSEVRLHVHLKMLLLLPLRLHQELHNGYCSCKVFTRWLCTRPVNQRKCVISFFLQFQSMGKTVMDCGNIYKSAARIYNGTLCTLISSEKKEPRISLCCIISFFFFGIYVIKNSLTV